MKVHVSPDFAYETDEFAAIRYNYNQREDEYQVEGMPIKRITMTDTYPNPYWLTLHFYTSEEKEFAEKAVRLFVDAMHSDNDIPRCEKIMMWNHDIPTLCGEPGIAQTLHGQVICYEHLMGEINGESTS